MVFGVCEIKKKYFGCVLEGFQSEQIFGNFVERPF